MMEKKFVPITVVPKRARRFTHGGLVALFLFIYFCVTRTSHDFGDSRETQSFSTQVTANVGGTFPRKIWQIWKVNPLEFDGRDMEVARSWTAKNPGYRYEVLTDQNDLEYVETNFGPAGENRPDIVEAYRSLTAPIIKADLLRYLVMYMEGGLYADIDVEALRPVERFIPSTHDEREIGMVIGIEIDEPQFRDHPILGPKSQSFCQWTFMCKPRQPVMMRIVENILRWLNDLSVKQGKPISELQLDFDDVITGTGPSAFTDAILSEMSRTTGQAVTWNTFHDIPESKVVGGFLVLTVEAFAAGQGHSDSGTHNSRNALVKHHYHASEWPKKHPRFYHPIFAEVERCNWNLDCVRKWDEETSAFSALPQDEQEQQIATFQAIGEALKNMEPPPQPALGGF